MTLDGEQSLTLGLEDELRSRRGPELEGMIESAREAANFLKALSHESRLLILCLLAGRERTVSELESLLSLRQPTVSQQLARLRLEGIVNARRDGKAIYYSIADDNTRRVVALIYEIFCQGKKGKK